MPHQEVSFLPNYAVLWPKNGYDSYGRPTVGRMVEIRCRWNTAQRESTDSQGNSITLTGDVAVDRDIDIGSRMWLGRLEDWRDVGTGLQDQEVHQVVAYNNTPDLKGRVAFRKVTLTRFREVHG